MLAIYTYLILIHYMDQRIYVNKFQTKSFINSNSILCIAWGSRQLKGKATVKAIVSCLEQNARAIELDVWYHFTRKRLVVAHGLPASSPVS